MRYKSIRQIASQFLDLWVNASVSFRRMQVIKCLQLLIRTVAEHTPKVQVSDRGLPSAKEICIFFTRLRQDRVFLAFARIFRVHCRPKVGQLLMRGLLLGWPATYPLG
jgi:hypothetical protein